MSDVAIAVENLSKSYLIGHQARQRERYAALRDVIAREARNFARRGLDLVRGRQIIQGDEVEEFWALRDVSFEVKRGEVIGVIGRNGAGKSTLLKILSRITEPDQGRAVLRGRVASLLEVGTGFHPELTGRENIFLNGTILGLTRAEILRKFDEIVRFAEVEMFLDTPVKRYSSGMYVRLAFAVAAHLESEILLVDEVLAVGDADFQKKCIGKMQDISRQLGRTILFISHNMGAIRSLCTRSIYLRGGTICGDGPTDRVQDAYAADIEVKGLVQLLGSDELQIESVILRGEDGQPSMTFRPSAPMTIEINFFAPKRLLRPYFYLEVDSVFGPAFSASMLSDGFRPNSLEGRGQITCHFQGLPLIPNTYTVRMGIRSQGGQRVILGNTRVAFFTVSSSLAEYGFEGELADALAGEAAPVVVPYTWRLPDGSSKKFQIC
jgi:lipopolysaccharide transport system ATP-binding protein